MLEISYCIYHTYCTYCGGNKKNSCYLAKNNIYVVYGCQRKNMTNIGYNSNDPNMNIHIINIQKYIKAEVLSDEYIEKLLLLL